MSSLLEEHIKGTVFIKRLMVMIVLQFIMILILISRLAYLQIIKFDNYRNKSENNRIKMNIIPPLRGNILDRNNNKLTNNRNGYELILYKSKKQNEDEFIEQISKILNLEENKKIRIKKQLKNNKNKAIVSVLNNLTWEELAKIESNSYKINNISIEQGHIREYLYGKEFAHILGYVATPNDRDIKKLSNKIDKEVLLHPNYKIGKNGLESKYNSTLTGKSGYKKIEVNAYNVPIKELERKESEKGSDIILTIDLRLQQFIYNRVKDLRAAIVVMNVNSGEILSMVSTPSFETNEFIDGISNQYWEELTNDERKPMYNKTISALYAMGSTFKPVVALSALENGWEHGRNIDCKGVIPISKKSIFRCWKKNGHGKINLIEALERSCNIYFANLGLFTGPNNIYNTASMLGIGQEFNIDLNEYNNGILPSPEWKKKIYKNVWTKGDTINMSIGQGYILANPLQMTVMISRIANNGYQIKPFLIHNSKIKEENKKLFLLQPMFNKNNIDIVKKGMYNVVNVKTGTASWMIIKTKSDKYQIAGKTGTAQVISLEAMEKMKEILNKDQQVEEKFRNHGIFVGFAPFNKPKYAISVVVEHGGGGSFAAAPIAMDILKFAIDNEI